jgi:hypothetical protein
MYSAFVLAFLTGHAIGVNNGLARTPQMGWVSNHPMADLSFYIPNTSRIIGMPLAAMSPNHSSSTLRKSSSTLACGMWDIIMLC